MEKTATQIAKENLDLIMGAASFDFNKITNLKDLFGRRQYIARNYSEELKSEFEHINTSIRQHLSL